MTPRGYISLACDVRGEPPHVNEDVFHIGVQNVLKRTRSEKAPENVSVVKNMFLFSQTRISLACNDDCN